MSVAELVHDKIYRHMNKIIFAATSLLKEEISCWVLTV